MNKQVNISIYTDGACSGNPGPGGFGYVVIMDDKEFARSDKMGYRKTTNNRMEIMAVINALQTINTGWLLDDIKHEQNQQGRETDIKVTVFSDSQLVVNTMNQGWARKSNQDLWEKLDNAIDCCPHGTTVSFVKVKGHTGQKDWNSVVDALAVEASSPQYAVLQDIMYEKICNPSKNDCQDSLFNETCSSEPEVTEIHLKGINTREERLVEVILSNGTVVKIEKLYGGFQQYDCTEREAKLTLDLAWKYCSWLNGGKLK